MNNFALFICGLVVTLISGLGILLYMVSVGYEQKKKKSIEVDADLGAAITPGIKKSSMDSFAGIPSVS